MYTSKNKKSGKQQFPPLNTCHILSLKKEQLSQELFAEIQQFVNAPPSGQWIWANLIFLVTLVIPNRDLPHQLNVCTEKVVKMKRDKNVAIFLRNFAHCAIMILIMLQQHLRNGFKIFLNSPLNFHTFDYFTSDIRCFPNIHHF